MKKQNKKIELEDWQAAGFKNGNKTQITVLAEPQPKPGDCLGRNPKEAFGFQYYQNCNTGNPTIPIKNTLGVVMGDLLYCKEHRLHLEVVDHVAVFHLNLFTDELALQQGIAELYPAGGTGGDGFYLPDEILEQTALSCFKHHWNSLPENKDHPFESNPYVIVYTLKPVKI